MTRRVLLTGATGFVGGHAAEAFARAGWTLRCARRATSDTRWIDSLGSELVPLDLYSASAEEALAAVAKVDLVVHAAGLTRARNPAEYWKVNADGTARLARAAERTGVSRFILVSSLAARGPDGAAAPVSDYGRSKREAEERLAEIADGMEAVVLRPAGVYGPRDTDLLPLFRTAARGWLPVPRKAAPLQPVYAADVADACLRVGEAERPGFGPWDVAEPALYGWDEVAHLMERTLRRSVRTVRLPGAVFEAVAGVSEVGARLLGRAPVLDRRRARDLARYAWTCDPGPAERAFGWRARTPLAEGLARTAAWYREVGWLAA